MSSKAEVNANYTFSLPLTCRSKTASLRTASSVAVFEMRSGTRDATTASRQDQKHLHLKRRSSVVSVHQYKDSHKECEISAKRRRSPHLARILGVSKVVGFRSKGK